MSTLAELLAQREAIEQQIDMIRKEERRNAIVDVLQIIKDFELTEQDLFGKKKGTPGVLPPKYRNPETGQTWSGKGRAPNWLEGRNREDFLI
jgi:DNA-binding protein H-NS